MLLPLPAKSRCPAMSCAGGFILRAAAQRRRKRLFACAHAAFFLPCKALSVGVADLAEFDAAGCLQTRVCGLFMRIEEGYFPV